MKRWLGLLMVLVVLGILMALPQAWRFGLGGSSWEWDHRQLRFTLRSPTDIYQPGEAVKIAVWVQNTGSEPYEFRTAGHPVQEPVVGVGLEEPRPAFDLIFDRQILTDQGWQPYHWIWSEVQGGLPPEIELTPGESRQLINLRWTPPATQPLGRFIFRFADFDRPTAIEVDRPLRH